MDKPSIAPKISAPKRIGLPTMRVLDLNHRVQNGVPGLRSFQGRIREHATIPTNVLNATLGRILEPISGTSNNVQLAIRIVSLAVLARLVVRTRPCT